MRQPARALFLGLVLAACDAEKQSKEALDRTAELQAQIDSLQREIEGLRAKLGIDEIERQVAALQGQATAAEAAIAKLQLPRVPHLIVRESGDDLGIWVGGLVTYSDRYKAPV